jgi:hypothetical protein
MPLTIYDGPDLVKATLKTQACETLGWPWSFLREDTAEGPRYIVETEPATTSVEPLPLDPPKAESQVMFKAPPPTGSYL